MRQFVSTMSITESDPLFEILSEGYLAAGTHSAILIANKLQSGVYFVSLTNYQEVQVQTVVLMK